MNIKRLLQAGCISVFLILSWLRVGYSQDVINDVTNTEFDQAVSTENISTNTLQLDTNLVNMISNVDYLYHASFMQKRDQIVELCQEKKDPLTAGMLSLLYAGAGQFYMKEFSKGSLLFLGETVYLLFFYGMRWKLQNSYGTTTSFKSINPSDKVLLISTFATYLALKVYSISDAYHSAVEYNESIDNTLQKLKLNISPEDLSMSINLRF